MKYADNLNSPVEKKQIRDILRLTPMQEGMLYDYLQSPSGSRYMEQLGLNLTGYIDVKTVESAWNAVIQNNEMLRAVFRWEKIKNPVQVILDALPVNMTFFDLSGSSPDEQAAFIGRATTEDRINAFDLRRPSFRILLFRTGSDRAHMVISNHHILYDGWSNGIILKEFLTAYNNIAEYRTPGLSKKSRFKEFLSITLNQENEESQRNFWKTYLSKEYEELSGKSRDKESLKRIKKPINGVEQFRFSFPSTITDRLQAFAKEHKITLATLMTGGWGLLLGNYNDSADIAFDTTVSGRNTKIKGIEDMVGLFINTLPLRIHPRPVEKVHEFIIRLEQESRRREEYENTPLSHINEYLEDYRLNSTEPLFSSVLILENYPLEKQLLQGNGKLRVESYSISGMTHYDLTLIITLFDGIQLEITYNSEVFDSDRIKQLVKHFAILLEKLVDSSSLMCTDLKVISDSQQEEISGYFLGKHRYDTQEEGIVIPPRDAVEEKLVRIWSEVLKRNQSEIGINSDFFTFGGHSLKASLLTARIQGEFSVKVPLEEIFKRPTLEQLAEYIKEVAPDFYEALDIIPSVEKRDYYELSSVQHRMVALQQMDPDNTAYNVTAIMEVSGVLGDKEIERLNALFKQLIDRHGCLRTSFYTIDGNPVQRIHDNVAFEINRFYISSEGDVSGDESSGSNSQLSPEGLSRLLPEFIHKFIRPFELKYAPLMRAALLKVDMNRHLLILDMHHIVTDGFSMDIFIRDLTGLYNGSQLPGPNKQYVDFSQWQYCNLQAGKLKKQEDYWLSQLAGEIPVLNLLTDFPRPIIQSFAGDRIYFDLDEELTRRIKRLARDTGATVFMILLAALNTVLSRYTGQEDIIIGTTVAGRSHPQLETIMGVFIETLALRNFPIGSRTFMDFLTEVKERTLEAYENQDYPFRELVKKAGSDIGMSNNPIFNIMLIVQNVDISGLEVEGLAFTPFPYFSRVSKLDITFEAVETENKIKCHLEYCTELFKRATIERLKVHILNVLSEVTINPGHQLSGIHMLSAEEIEQVTDEFALSHWEPEESSFPGYKRIEELFERQVAKTPDHIAVVAGQKRNTYLTYRMLNDQAESLAKRIEEL